jgi:hypothetical protein
MLRRPLEMERLKIWAINKTAKEKENRTHPYANSPSFKKDFTLNEEKKQKRIPRRSRTSKAVGRKPKGECAPVVPNGSADAPLVRNNIRKQNKIHTFKRTSDLFFLFIVFTELFCFSGISQCLL